MGEDTSGSSKSQVASQQVSRKSFLLTILVEDGDENQHETNQANQLEPVARFLGRLHDAEGGVVDREHREREREPQEHSIGGVPPEAAEPTEARAIERSTSGPVTTTSTNTSRLLTARPMNQRQLHSSSRVRRCRWVRSTATAHSAIVITHSRYTASGIALPVVQAECVGEIAQRPEAARRDERDDLSPDSHPIALGELPGRRGECVARRLEPLAHVAGEPDVEEVAAGERFELLLDASDAQADRGTGGRRAGSRSQEFIASSTHRGAGRQLRWWLNLPQPLVYAWDRFSAEFDGSRQPPDRAGALYQRIVAAVGSRAGQLAADTPAI